MKLRYANIDDATELIPMDTHITAQQMHHKIQAGQVIVVEINSKIVGFLRYGLFWDEIPFMNMLWVESQYRNQGIGSALVKYWESEMQRLNHALLLTSTMDSENAQHFYRHLGYQDCGIMSIEPSANEIIMKKTFSMGDAIKKDINK